MIEAIVIATVLWLLVHGSVPELWAALAFALTWRNVFWILPGGTIRQFLRWKPLPKKFVQHARERFEAMPIAAEYEKAQAAADLLRALRATARWDEAHQFLNNYEWPVELQRCKAMKQQWRASLLYGEKRYAESLGAWSAEAALKDDQEVLRAQIHVRLQQFSKAQEWIARAKRKKHLDVSCTLGAIEEEKGNFENALRYFEIAALHTTFPVLRDMARVLMAMTDWQEAAPLWERAFRQTEFINTDDLRQAATCWRNAANVRRADYLERELARWEYSQPQASNAKGALN